MTTWTTSWPCTTAFDSNGGLYIRHPVLGGFKSIFSPSDQMPIYYKESVHGTSDTAESNSRLRQPQV